MLTVWSYWSNWTWCWLAGGELIWSWHLSWSLVTHSYLDHVWTTGASCLPATAPVSGLYHVITTYALIYMLISHNFATLKPTLIISFNANIIAKHVFMISVLSLAAVMAVVAGCGSVSQHQVSTVTLYEEKLSQLWWPRLSVCLGSVHCTYVMGPAYQCLTTDCCTVHCTICRATHELCHTDNCYLKLISAQVSTENWPNQPD